MQPAVNTPFRMQWRGSRWPGSFRRLSGDCYAVKRVTSGGLASATEGVYAGEPWHTVPPGCGVADPRRGTGVPQSWLRGDLLAGVTVAAYLVPQVMAYARVAGLSPAAGLWAAVPALVTYAAMGSSRSLSLGPEATIALMTAIAIGPLAEGNPARYATLAATLALLAGAMAIAAGLARLGFLADLLSRPVLVGYLTGVALIMIAGQPGAATGVPVTGEEFLPQVATFAGHLGDARLATSLVTVAVLAVRPGPRTCCCQAESIRGGRNAKPGSRPGLRAAVTRSRVAPGS